MSLTLDEAASALDAIQEPMKYLRELANLPPPRTISAETLVAFLATLRNETDKDKAWREFMRESWGINL